MKGIVLTLVLLATTGTALAQSIDVSSQPVPGFFNSNDTNAAIKFAVTATDRPLSEYVQKCYFTVARKFPVGSIESYQAVAFCAEVDMAGIILNERAPDSGLPAQRDDYFTTSKAESRIGTELISFAGLNTYQAYQSISWLKSVMIPMVNNAAAKTGRSSTVSGIRGG